MSGIKLPFNRKRNRKAVEETESIRFPKKAKGAKGRGRKQEGEKKDRSGEKEVQYETQEREGSSREGIL